MSTNTATRTAVPVEKVRDFQPAKVQTLSLFIGLAGIVLTVIGFFISPERVSFSGLISVMFWLSIGLGMLFLVMLHHIFDAGWSTVIRRPLEHGLAVFPWLALMMAPLILISLYYDGGGFIWMWMAAENVADDLLYAKKSEYLSNGFFVIRYILFFALWIGLSYLLRKASFAQDKDGNPKWTSMNRKLAAAGIIVGAVTLTFASIDWIKTLDHHWFSTMFGVWYFAGAIRASLAVLIIVCVLLVKFGPLKGLFQPVHLYEIGRLKLAFTIFWAYIAFSQYFLILNANIPEETFWYVIREGGNWWNVGLALLFGNFFAPFVFLLFYGNKVNSKSMVGLAVWTLLFHLIDIYYNILPSRVDDTWTPIFDFPIFNLAIFWDIAALVGIGGICAWAYMRSYRTQNPIPLRDPRILESIHHHG